jgi:hypothetical protein
MLQFNSPQQEESKMRVWLALVCLVACAAQAQEKLTANTLTLAKGQASPPASISEMAWYAGQWCGDGLGGMNEEIWSEPRGGVMMGMYRL